MYKAMKVVHEGTIPPEAGITAPEWYSEVDPAQQSTETVSAEVAARRAASYGWKLQYAPGVQPTDEEWKTISSGTWVKSRRWQSSAQSSGKYNRRSNGA